MSGNTEIIAQMVALAAAQQAASHQRRRPALWMI
jgi:hypothetical protein